jgi:hypothetical protein
MWTEGFEVSRMRKKIFNKDFMEKIYAVTHKNSLGWNIGAGGYPDCGSGLYSSKLSYE